MSDLFEISKAVADVLEAAIGDTHTVVHNEPAPADPNAVLGPQGEGSWIGVYEGTADMEKVVIGAGKWQLTASAEIVIEAASAESGAAACRRVNDAVKDVVEALKADKTLGGTVQYISKFRVEQRVYETKEQTFHRTAAVIVSAVGDWN